MEQIEHLKEILAPVFEACSVKLYEMKWSGTGKNRTLEVAITKEDGTMDLDTCALVSEKVSEVLDKEDSLSDAYTLEVCSPGAEREIHDLNELKTMKEPYVFIKFKNPVNKLNEVTGSIVSYSEDMIQLSYRVKQATKLMEFTVDDIAFIRLAVKF
jgi:ribosome maturation factor RimP